MNNVTLARSYLSKAQVRLRMLDFLIDERAYSVDFIPTAEYTRDDAERARRGARTAVEAARLVITA